MTIPVITFFNNKGGVGKTSMVYHLAWMFSDHGLRVIAADIDPQSNLTAAFLDEDRLEQVMMPGDGRPLTIYGAILPLKEGTGDIADPHVEIISDRLGLILGDMAMSPFEDDLSEVWPKCLDGDPRAFRIMSAFWRLVQTAGKKHGADVILIDQNEERVREMDEIVTEAVRLDATDEKALKSVDIEEVDAAVVSIGKRMEN